MIFMAAAAAECQKRSFQDTSFKLKNLHNKRNMRQMQQMRHNVPTDFVHIGQIQVVKSTGEISLIPRNHTTGAALMGYILEEHFVTV
jgi:hypothetical protein